MCGAGIRIGYDNVVEGNRGVILDVCRSRRHIGRDRSPVHGNRNGVGNRCCAVVDSQFEDQFGVDHAEPGRESRTKRCAIRQRYCIAAGLNPGVGKALITHILGTKNAFLVSVRTRVDHHDVAGLRERDGGAILVTSGRGIDLELGAYEAAVRVIALRENAFLVGILSHPGDHEMAVVHHGDTGLFLFVGGRGVDLELRAQGVAGGVIALAENAFVVHVDAFPDDNKASVAGHGDGGFFLVACEIRVYLEFTAQHAARTIEALCKYASEVSVRRAPGDNEAAVVRHSQRRLFLVSGGSSVDLELATDLVAGGIVALPQNTVEICVHTFPDHDEAAIVRHRDPRLFLIAAGDRVHHEFAANSVGSGIIALAEHAFLVGVLSFPDHDKAAVAVDRNRSLFLIPRGAGVDLKFFAHDVARGAEALAEHAFLVVILAFPDHDVAAVVGDRQFGFFLVASGCRIGRPLATAVHQC